MENCLLFCNSLRHPATRWWYSFRCNIKKEKLKNINKYGNYYLSLRWKANITSLVTKANKNCKKKREIIKICQYLVEVIVLSFSGVKWINSFYISPFREKTVQIYLESQKRSWKNKISIIDKCIIFFPYKCETEKCSIQCFGTKQDQWFQCSRDIKLFYGIFSALVKILLQKPPTLWH